MLISSTTRLHIPTVPDIPWALNGNHVNHYFILKIPSSVMKTFSLCFMDYVTSCKQTTERFKPAFFWLPEGSTTITASVVVMANVLAKSCLFTHPPYFLPDVGCYQHSREEEEI